jgi:ribosomal protein S17E
MQHKVLPKSLNDKIGNSLLTRQFVQRITKKVIDEFIDELNKNFEEENVKALAFYEPVSNKNERTKVIGIAVAFMDENDNVSSLEHWRFHMARLNSHKPRH